MTSLSGVNDHCVPHVPAVIPTLPGYQILEPLGSGGMGSVWRARQLATQRIVALKLISGPAFQSNLVRQRFIREVELAAQLEHPSITRVYDSGVDRSIYYYSMELVDGRHLDRYVREQALSSLDALRLVLQVCDAVAFAHRNGIIHRDLKPSNILVDADGVPHLVDFGLARTADVAGELPRISVEGEMAGTLEYMAPEQAAGETTKIDAQCDVYSLGVVCYELLTGQLPHDASGSPYERRKRLIEGEPRPASATGVRISADLEAILAKAVARDRDERYGRVEQLADDLRAFLAGAPVSARRLTVGYFLTKWAARRRMPLAIGLTLALVGIASGVYAYGWWTAQKSRAEAEAQHARHSRYINQITSARKAIEEHDVKHAQQLLARTPPAERGWEWRWLSHVADSSVFTARLPDRGNGAVFFSRDGRQLRAVRPNGQMLAWDLATGSRIDRPPDTPVNASTARAATNAPVVLFTTPEGRIGVWDPRTDTRKSVMTDSDLRLSRPKISPTGRHVTWSTAQGALAVWNTQTGMVTTHASTGLRPIAISSHNAVIVVQGDSATYRYSWPNGQLDKTPLTRSSTIPSGSFSPDGRWLALLDEPADHLQIYRLDPNKASRQRTIETRTGIRKIVFSNDGELLAAASANRVIRVWSLRDDRLVSVLRGHASAPVALRFSDSGRAIASVGWNGTVKVWRLHQSSLPTRVWHSASSGITCMDVNEAHRLIAVGLADGSVGLVESASQQVRMLNGRHPGQVVSVNAGGKAPVISSVCSAETILLHRPATGSSTALSHRPDEQILHAKVSPRGGFVAIRSTSGIAVHHVSTGKTLLQIPRAAGCAWSPDGRRLLIARADPNQQSIRLGRVDLADRQVRWLGRVDGVDLHDMCIDDAGRSIAILSPDGRVRIWNVAQRRATTVIDTRHPRVGQIRCRFNADGTRILTSGHTAKLWDVETGIQLLELINRGSRRPITYAAFSNDDTTVTAAQGHRVVQWAPRGVRRTP